MVESSGEESLKQIITKLLDEKKYLDTRLDKIETERQKAFTCCCCFNKFRLYRMYRCQVDCCNSFYCAICFSMVKNPYYCNICTIGFLKREKFINEVLNSEIYFDERLFSFQAMHIHSRIKFIKYLLDNDVIENDKLRKELSIIMNKDLGESPEDRLGLMFGFKWVILVKSPGYSIYYYHPDDRIKSILKETYDFKVMNYFSRDYLGVMCTFIELINEVLVDKGLLNPIIYTLNLAAGKIRLVLNELFGKC